MIRSDEVFKKLEARLAKNDPNDRGIQHVYKFIVTDDKFAVVKTWILDLKQFKLYVGSDNAECSVKIKDSTIMDICEKKVDAVEALNDGLIEVKGNFELVFLLKPFVYKESASE